MAKVKGIGGIFFKSDDPAKLSAWYQQWLGMGFPDPGCAIFNAGDMSPDSYTVWSPFEKETHYFDPSNKAFMFNLIVDDLAGALSQVSEGGAEIVGEVEESEYGRFGWFLDPEGNKVELWEP